MTAGTATAGRGSIGAEDERLRAAAAGPGHADAGRIDVGQPADEVQRPDRIVGLQAEDGLQPGLGLRTEKAPFLRIVHLRTARPRDAPTACCRRSRSCRNGTRRSPSAPTARSGPAADNVRLARTALRPRRSACEVLRSGVVESSLRPVAVRRQARRATCRVRPLGRYRLPVTKKPG